MSVNSMKSGSSSPPRSIDEIRRQLADLTRVKQEALAHGTPDFASQVGMQTILGHEQELKEELRAADELASSHDSANNDDEPLVSGPPVSNRPAGVSRVG